MHWGLIGCSLKPPLFQIEITECAPFGLKCQNSGQRSSYIHECEAEELDTKPGVFDAGTERDACILRVLGLHVQI